MNKQTDQKFQQNELVITKPCGGKAFAAEEKIHELKKIPFKSNNDEKKKGKRINSKELINKATNYQPKLDLQNMAINQKK